MKKNLVLGLGFGLGGVIATLSIIQMGLMAHNMKINNNNLNGPHANFGSACCFGDAFSIKYIH